MVNDNLLKLITITWDSFQKYNSQDITLNDLSLKIVTGKTPSTRNKNNYGKDVPFVKIPDMHNKVFVTNTSQMLSYSGANTQSKKYIPANSIIVSCIGTPGLVSLTDQDVQTNQQINSIILDRKYVYYVFIYLRKMKEMIGALGSGGTTIKNLNKTDFGNIQVRIPNEPRLKSFNNVVTPLFKNIHNNLVQNELLTKLKNELLGKYF